MTKPAPNKTKAKPLLRWSLNSASLEFAVDRATLTRRLRAASIEPGPDGKYTTAEIIAGAFGDLERERIRETSAAADLREMKRDELKGLLLPKDEVMAHFMEIGTAIRQTIENSALPTADQDKVIESLFLLSQNNWGRKP